MTMSEIDFNKIRVKGLSIFVDNKEVAFGYKDEVLKHVQHLKNCVIKSTNFYFDTFVIRI